MTDYSSDVDSLILPQGNSLNYLLWIIIFDNNSVLKSPLNMTERVRKFAQNTRNKTTILPNLSGKAEVI